MNDFSSAFGAKFHLRRVYKLYARAIEPVRM